MRGLFAPEDCEAATQRVVERQEVMRLSLLPGKDQPVQMIRARARAAIRFARLPAADCRREGLENAMREVFHEPFDLVQGPLYRVKVFRRSADDQLLIFSIHHAIADGWSLGAFVHDLCEAYARGRMGVAGGLPPRGCLTAAGALRSVPGNPRLSSNVSLSGDPFWLGGNGSGPPR